MIFETIGVVALAGAGFAGYKYYKKHKAAVDGAVKGLPNPTAVAPAPIAAIAPAPVAAAQAAHDVVATSPMGTDAYPSDTINSLLGKLKGFHASVVALGKPGSNGKDPPISTDGKAVDAGPYWGARATQAGATHSLTQKQQAEHLQQNSAEQFITAASTGNYAAIFGA